MEKMQKNFARFIPVIIVDIAVVIAFFASYFGYWNPDVTNKDFTLYLTLFGIFIGLMNGTSCVDLFFSKNEDGSSKFGIPERVRWMGKFLIVVYITGFAVIRRIYEIDIDSPAWMQLLKYLYLSVVFLLFVSCALYFSSKQRTET